MAQNIIITTLPGRPEISSACQRSFPSEAPTHVPSPFDPEKKIALASARLSCQTGSDCGCSPTAWRHSASIDAARIYFFFRRHFFTSLPRPGGTTVGYRYRARHRTHSRRRAVALEVFTRLRTTMGHQGPPRRPSRGPSRAVSHLGRTRKQTYSYSPRSRPIHSLLDRAAPAPRAQNSAGRAKGRGRHKGDSVQFDGRTRRTSADWSPCGWLAGRWHGPASHRATQHRQAAAARALPHGGARFPRTQTLCLRAHCTRPSEFSPTQAH